MENRKLANACNMSVYSARTGLSSILKSFSPLDRDKAKHAAINKVRFEMPKEQGLVAALEAVLNYNDYAQYNEFVAFLREGSLTDADFQRVICEARQSINLLTPKFTSVVEAILSVDWQNRSESLISDFIEFFIDLLVAHTKYVHFGISRLIAYWIPNEKDEENWPKGTPSDVVRKQLEIVHQVMRRLPTIMPMSFDIILDSIEKLFPYYKKPAYVVGGYVHNVISSMEPISADFLIHLLFRKLLELDANAARADIEDAEYEEEEDDIEEAGGVFPIDMDSERVGNCSDGQVWSPLFNETYSNICDTGQKFITEHIEKLGQKFKIAKLTMKHSVAETLDVCLEKVFTLLESIIQKSPTSRVYNSQLNNNLNTSLVNNRTIDTALCFRFILDSFDDIILPSHNTHHVQFLLFYFCSFKPVLAEKFLATLWGKVMDPNASTPIRQSSVGYVASFLARSKFISTHTIQNYLSEMATWVHHYIQRTDAVRSNCSLKANLVFFAVCQAIFYVIAFRSRDLTHNKASLLFLQSLQLSAIVGCTFNPLRVCLPAVATAFAGVTRAYQLAYCHAILERNARRKLATVYANEISTPEECLETFFPFDPYLLKKSSRFITPIYLQYQASEAEEHEPHFESGAYRKRKESVSSNMGVDDVDDFLVDKKQRLCELSRSQEKEMQFTYGLSPGFHV